MSNVRKRLHEQLEKRQENLNLRTLKLRKGLVDFSSNDYLGLSRHEQLKSSIREMFELSGSAIGSTGSRLLSGNSSLHVKLEAELAEFFMGEAALLFNSGYTANLALISSVPQRGDTILYDQHIHACIKEGARLSQAKYISFRHNDPKDLGQKLNNSSGNKFVVVESLYSMEGDYSPINDFVQVCSRHDAELIIDEAHTSGWAGPHGRGWVIDKDLSKKFLGRVYTFGKGFGTHGACVVGSKVLIDYLINFSRPFIYTTALPPHSVISINCALEFLNKDLLPGKQLLKRIEYYLEVASALKVEGSLNHNSPIQWINARGNRKAISLSNQLADKGFDLRPILSPTVPKGKERLRVCIHSFNTEQQIEDLLAVITNRE